MSTHEPAKDRYERMKYRHCGKSGLKLPAISLGAWETFGNYDDQSVARDCIYRAFDLGITHFDFANNYGNPPGNAEIVCGRTLKDLPRDEILIASKAGFPMWPGPYGDGGSRKYLIASCDQSLKRLGVEYLDIFYHHRPDPKTPVEESIGAIATLIEQGKVLYAGVSSYSGEQYAAAVEAAKACGIRIAIHQPYFNLLGRRVEKDLLPHIAREGSGVIAFCPLASGLLTDKHLDGNVPAGDRGGLWPGAWVRAHSQEKRAEILNGLNAIAKARGQSLAQMSLAWILHNDLLTSVAVGASRVAQVEANVKALDNLEFSPAELAEIDRITLEEPARKA
jgi:L-glyceraldehyde 3-phosphate reductase